MNLTIGLASIAVVLAMLACGGSTLPNTSPEAISTIVAATMAALPSPVSATVAASSPALASPTASTQSSNATLPPPLPPTLALPPATRINFLEDATTAVLSGPIDTGQTLSYVLRALQGQPMLLNVDSVNQDVTLSLKTQGGTSMLGAAAHQSTWQGTLPQTEDYYVTLYGGATTENFTLTVTIPSRIKFAEGADSAKLSGKTVAGYTVAYTVFAVKGQKMTVDLTNLSGEAALTIYGFTDGQPYVRSVTEQTSFSFKLPATQDYIVQVVPKGGSAVSYLMAVKIQ